MPWPKVYAPMALTVPKLPTLPGTPAIEMPTRPPVINAPGWPPEPLTTPPPWASATATPRARSLK